MTVDLPATYRAVRVHKLSTDFAAATRIEEMPMSDLLAKLGPGDALIQAKYAGVNASDLNMSAGRYDTTIEPPFTAGMEGMGFIVKLGADSPAAGPFKVGAAVGYMTFGAYAEYLIVPTAILIPLPECQPKYVGALVSGLTAAMALSELGRPQATDTVLITAAAGGAGQMAVQWAKKHCGCKQVIGTCSTQEKADMLRRLGCDRVVLYKQENLAEVLQKEYPHGVDLVFESVGGETLQACLSNLAVRGRLLVIGSITNYQNDTGRKMVWNDSVHTLALLGGSKTVSGFFLPQFKAEMAKYAQMLIKDISAGKLAVQCDTDGFRDGVASVAGAVAHLHTGRNIGKVLVSFGDDSSKL